MSKADNEYWTSSQCSRKKGKKNEGKKIWLNKKRQTHLHWDDRALEEGATQDLMRKTKMIKKRTKKKQQTLQHKNKF